MNRSGSYAEYVDKMLGLRAAGVDLAVDARFIDALAPRTARILDVGCGIGNAVQALRRKGHDAYGIDPTPELYDAACSLHPAAWFRQLGAGEVTENHLTQVGLHPRWEIVLLSGNTAAFLSEADLAHLFTQCQTLLTPGGALVIGTTTNAKGGVATQDRLAEKHSLTLVQRFADWHLSAFTPSSPWSVSVYSRTAQRGPFGAPDGMFVLPSVRD